MGARELDARPLRQSGMRRRTSAKGRYPFQNPPGRRPQLSFEVEDKEAESSSGEDIESTETSTCPVAVRAYGDIPNLENDAPRFEDFI